MPQGEESMDRFVAPLLAMTVVIFESFQGVSHVR